MKIRNEEDLRKFEKIIDQCAKPVWIVTPSGEQFNLKNPLEREHGLSHMICKKDYEEPEVYTSCTEDEMLMFGFIEDGLKLAA